jgi:ATP-dependent Clp protease ATP-binding subunit ClpA
MLFADDVLTPEKIEDPRLGTALRAALELPCDILRPADLLAVLIHCGDEAVKECLGRALSPNTSLPDFVAALEADRAPSEGVTARTRNSFTAAALAALDEFEKTLIQAQGCLGKVGLEILTFTLLTHLEQAEREKLSPLIDVEQAAFLLWKRVARGFDVGPLMDRIFTVAEGEEDTEEESLAIPAEIMPSEDLTELARTVAGEGPFPYDGEPQFDRLFEETTRALHRRRPHVLLVGERGVCTGTVVAELARRATAGDIPSLSALRFLRVDCRRVPPDESQQRLAALLNCVAEDPRRVVVLDGFASLFRGGQGANNKTLLLSALDCLRCRLIGILTPHDYQELVEDELDLSEWFTRIDVLEPEPEVALKIMSRFAVGMAHQYQVGIEEEAVRQAVYLSANHILHDQLPAKALKVLHRACEDLAYFRQHQGIQRDQVNADDIFRIVSEKTGVPEPTLRGIGDDSDFEQMLRQFIIGQDHAVREVATELGLIKAGMSDPGKPASVMLFLGQTGTGKTEMARVLARLYSTSGRLRTYTLGNCVEPHSVSTIIGVPPGYVGYDQGGRVVNELNADPYGVFLLDEADKAHPDALQPFLNLFDVSWVEDQRGVRAYGDKALFILTTNVGQRMMAEMVEQGKSPDEIRDRMKEVLAQIKHSKAERPVFSPEFLARIKRIIVFNPLDRFAMEGITRKLFRELQESWSVKRSRRLEVPEELISIVAARAHELNEKSKGREGGRIIGKLISDWVEAPLQRAISQRSREYRECQSVSLECCQPEGSAGKESSAPVVSVRFISALAA